MTATINGFTSAAVSIASAYAPESIKVADDSANSSPCSGLYFLRRPQYGRTINNRYQTGSTNLKLTAGKITKTVPITVLSRNLLSYGPASGNGLTATVNNDGSLHVTGTVTSRHKGLAWRRPTPSDALGKTVTYKAESPSDTYSYVAFFNKAGNQVGDLALNKSVTVPADAASCELRLLAGDTYTVGTRIDDTFKPMLNLGDRALDWMKPDNTSLRGGQ